MKKYYHFFLSVFFVVPVLHQSIGQAPANNECSGAITITTTAFGTSCSSSTTATTVNASASLPAPICGSTTANDDIWYRFTANAQSVIIRVTNAVQVPSGTANISMDVSSGSCASLTSAFCENGFAFGGGLRIINGLTIGNTYFLRFWTASLTNEANFDFCIQDVPAPPANDECANAIPVTTQPFGTSCAASVSANTTGATQSSPNPSCTSIDNNDDIWYSFTANSASVILRFSNGIQTTTGNTGSLGYALYNGSCPSTSTTLSCATTIGFGAGFKIIDGLTIGSTYFLRLFSQGINNYMSFSFCIQDVPTAPVNDECVNAIPITTQPFGIACTASVSANTTGSTQSLPNPSCTGTINNDDIWYSFTANSASIILRFNNAVETIDGSTGSLGYALYSGSCPSTTTTLSCATTIGFGAGFKIIDGLTIGNTYFLRLFSQNGNNYMSFTFCVQDVPPPPVNDECVNAITVTTQPFGASCAASVSANTTGATQSSPKPSCTGIDDNDDIWYSFTANSASIILRFSNAVEITNGNTGSLGYALYSGSCPSTTTTLSCATTIGFGAGFKIIDGLTIGNTYFLRLFSQNGNNYMSFTFCVQDVPPPPVNDECVNAIPVSLTLPGSLCLSTVSANTTGATLSANSAACTTTNSNNDDTWYSFTASAGTAIFRFSNCIETISGNTTTLGYALYTTCPSGTSSLLCDNNIGFGSGLTTLTGLIPGNIYLLRLYGTNPNNYISVNFCVQAPLQNDECVNALAIPVSNGFCTTPVLTSLNGATTSPGFALPSCRITGSSRDVWFFTTIPATGNLIIQTAAIKVAGNNLVLTAFTGVCSSLTEIACNDDGNPETFPSADHSRITFSGRSPGEIITLRVTAATSSNEEQFAICAWDETVSVLPPVSSGGNCITGVVTQIDSSKGNLYMWVPLFDNTGNIIAEIYSDGSIPGPVTPFLFVNSGPVRQFGSRFYLDRNMSIQTTNALTTPVKVRWYIKQTELNALQAVDPSVSGISQLKVTKTNTTCQPAYSGTPTVIFQQANANYGTNFYLQFATTGFSGFYLDGLSGVLPLKVVRFTAVRKQSAVSLEWSVVKDSSILLFEVEKSENGIQFNTTGIINKNDYKPGNAGEWNYSYIEPSHSNTIYYYRIKLTGINGKSIYSNIEKLLPSNKRGPVLIVYPNPVISELIIEIPGIINNHPATITITGFSGKKIKQYQQIHFNGKTSLNINDLANGIYLLQVRIGENLYAKKFVK